MMAQDMFEENKVLQAEVDGFRSLIESWIPHMTSQMREQFENSLENEDEDEETCEVCTMWKPQCECEEVSDG